MGINKSFATAQEKVMWGEEEAATVRGLTTTDLTNILIAEGKNIYALFEEFDSLRNTAGVDPRNTDQVADALMRNAPMLLAKIGEVAPTMLARVIAVAADDNTDEAMESILRFPAPLQVDVLTRIARQTFIGPEGFRVFLGNVQALVAAFAGMTNAERRAKLGMPESDSETGAATSSS